MTWTCHMEHSKITSGLVIFSTNNTAWGRDGNMFLPVNFMLSSVTVPFIAWSGSHASAACLSRRALRQSPLRAPLRPGPRWSSSSRPEMVLFVPARDDSGDQRLFQQLPSTTWLMQTTTVNRSSHRMRPAVVVWSLGRQENLRTIKLLVCWCSLPLPLHWRFHPWPLRQHSRVTVQLRPPLLLKPSRCSTKFQKGKIFLFLPFCLSLLVGLQLLSHYFSLLFA
jgi:hypothetical protein